MGDSFSNLHAAPLPQLLYRCVCGSELYVHPDVGSICKECDRAITPDAIHLAMAATLSMDDVLGRHAIAALADTPQFDPLCHQLLGHFRLDCRLGAGGMGAVYRALDTSLQRYVAVKVLRGNSKSGSSASDPKKVTNLLQEAVAQARLNHPHVVTIYYVGRHQGEPFLAMELVGGETLGESLKQGPLPYPRVILTAIQVADALKHSHHFGIVHGDIKPSNLLVASPTHIKLSDFGLSRFSTLQAVDEKLSGTPAYLAPELVAGSPSSMQSDMYALGVTLYELTFGHLPISTRGLTVNHLVQEIDSEELAFPQPWPHDVPVEWAGVLRRLMAYSSAQRYLDYDELLRDLRRLMPVTTTQAASAPRAMAYLLDQAILLTFIGPFAFLLLAVNQAESLQNFRILEPLIAACSLMVPAVHLFLIRRGWRTVGRYLFQLQVVDEHGLPLESRARMTREFLRSMFAWLAPFAAYAGLYSPFVDTVIDGLLIIFLAIDIICSFIRRDRRALHDLICHSRVVLDQGARQETALR